MYFRMLLVYIICSICLGRWSLAFGAQFQDSYPALRYRECVLEYGYLLQTITAYQEGLASLTDYYEKKDIYVDCHNTQLDQAQHMLDQGVTLHTEGNYEEALQTYEHLQTLFVNTDPRIQGLMTQAYLQRARVMYDQELYIEALARLQAAREIVEKDSDQEFEITYLEAVVRFALRRRDEAQRVALRAQVQAPSDEDTQKVDRLLDHISLRLDATTNDAIGWQQFRIQAMNIDKARSMITTPHEVVVAVIDAGIDMTHPDMQGQIWSNSDEIPQNAIDDDGNGYVDDLNGWNFIDRSGDVTPYGSHGTQVAGIIGALPNNTIGIAGITSSVKLMPIIICREEDCYNSAYMARAIRYAVDNGAHIINLSLASKNGEFLPDLTDAFTYAYLRGVVVVVAAGNGEEVAGVRQGINTSATPLSPVCNESVQHIVIGVGSVDRQGLPHTRANYGRCVDMYAYGEGVVSTAWVESDFGEYVIADGTSLAAPIIAGIVGLGYNRYGYVHPHVVYDALLASDALGGVAQADDFLRTLGHRYLGSPERDALVGAYNNLVAEISSHPVTEQEILYLHLHTLLDMLQERFRKEKNWKDLSKVYELQTMISLHLRE